MVAGCEYVAKDGNQGCSTEQILTFLLGGNFISLNTICPWHLVVDHWL